MFRKVLCLLLVSFTSYTIYAQSLEAKLLGKWKYDSTIANNKRIRNAGNPKSDCLIFSNDTLTITQYGEKTIGKYVLEGHRFTFIPFKHASNKFVFKIIYINENKLVITDDAKNDLNIEVKLYLSKE